MGSVVGYYSYLDTTGFIYSIEKATDNGHIFGGGDNLKNGIETEIFDKYGIFDKSTLTSKVLADFGDNFKADYEENINDGFPILDWQPQESAVPNV